jgi:hypothetical protein
MANIFFTHIQQLFEQPATAKVKAAPIPTN